MLALKVVVGREYILHSVQILSGRRLGIQPPLNRIQGLLFGDSDSGSSISSNFPSKLIQSISVLRITSVNMIPYSIGLE